MPEDEMFPSDEPVGPAEAAYEAGDTPLTPDQLRRLFAEWRDDAAQAPLHDAGVHYEDEPSRPLDRRETEPAPGHGLRHPEDRDVKYEDAVERKLDRAAMPDSSARAQYQQRDPSKGIDR